MTLLYAFLNIIVGLSLFVLPFALITYVLKLKIINPYYIMAALQFPVFFSKNVLGPWFNFENGVLDYWYNYSFFIQNIYTSGYVLTFTLALIFFSRLPLVKVNRWLAPVALKYSSQDLVFIANIFFFFALLVLFYLMGTTIGVVNWVLDPRTGYQFNRVGNGHLFAVAIFFLSISVVLLFLSGLSTLRFLIYGLACCFVSYLFGSKMVILEFFIFLLVGLWFKRFRYIRALIVLGGGGAFAMMLVNYGSYDLASIFKYFDYHNNSAMFYEYVFNTGFGFEGEIFVTGFWEYVPRAFFPDKPFVYGDVLIREIFWPGAAERTHTPGMAGPVGIYGDFGVVGVIFLSFFQPVAIFSAFASIYCYKEFFRLQELGIAAKGYNINYVFIVCFSYVFAPAFLMYFPVVLGWILLIMVCGFMFFISRLSLALARRLK